MSFIQTDNYAMFMNSDYGFAAGKNNIFALDGTSVVPSFLDNDGNIKWKSDGSLPDGLNFYIDSKTGNTYFRGNVYADNGYFKGELKAATGTFTGTLKAGTIEAGKIKGDLQADDTGGWLVGCGIKVGENSSAPNGYNFYVDANGNVTINNGSIAWSAVTGTDEIDSQISSAQSKADSAYDLADDAYDEASDASTAIAKLVSGRYSTPQSTFINGTTVKSPTIDGGIIRGAEIYGGKFGDLTSNNDPNVWLEMGMLNGGYSMCVWNKEYKNVPMFSIWDNWGGNTALYMKGSIVLRQDSTIVKPVGTWSFEDCDVQNLRTTAVFA